MRVGYKMRCFGRRYLTEVGTEGRAKVEQRLKTLEGGFVHKMSGTGKGKKQIEKYDNKKTLEGQPR